MRYDLRKVKGSTYQTEPELPEVTQDMVHWKQGFLWIVEVGYIEPKSFGQYQQSMVLETPSVSESREDSFDLLMDAEGEPSLVKEELAASELLQTLAVMEQEIEAERKTLWKQLEKLPYGSSWRRERPFFWPLGAAISTIGIGGFGTMIVDWGFRTEEVVAKYNHWLERSVEYAESRLFLHFLGQSISIGVPLVAGYYGVKYFVQQYKARKEEKRQEKRDALHHQLRRLDYDLAVAQRPTAIYDRVRYALR